MTEEQRVRVITDGNCDFSRCFLEEKGKGVLVTIRLGYGVEGAEHERERRMQERRAGMTGDTKGVVANSL